jgi:hypothetical protein
MATARMAGEDETAPPWNDSRDKPAAIVHKTRICSSGAHDHRIYSLSHGSCSGHSTRQSAEIYSRLALADAQQHYEDVIGDFPV